MDRKTLCALVTLISCLFPIGACADGMMVPDEATWRKIRERALVNEPEQKAVVFFTKGSEQLIISPSYEGPSSNFAWIVPVPARPKVEIMKGALFHELAKLTMPRPVGRSDSKGPVAGAAPGVTVLERKTVGAYDVSVLAATDGRALMKWLAANKYHLPSKALEPIKGYVKARWTFVACRIKAPAAAKGLATGTLAPLKLTFPTKKPVYPLKLSSANPKHFDLLVYLIMPSGELVSNATRIPVSGVPAKVYGNVTFVSATLPEGQAEYPTLARLSYDALKVFRLNYRVEPSECKSDIYWSPLQAAVAMGWGQ